MSDLISRDDVYKSMEDVFNSYCNNKSVFDEYDTRVVKKSFEELFRRFRQIPKAYDVDKVVEALEKEVIALEDNYGDLVECIPKEIAILIVKKGGVE